MSSEKSSGKRKAPSAEKAARQDWPKKPRFEDSTKDRKDKKDGKEKSWKKSDDDGTKANGTVYEKGATTSREAHAKQKQLAQERRSAKPLAEELARAKKLWERLRRKSHVPKDERQTLVDELFGITTGRIRDFVLKHDAVRAVQTAVKYSTPEQRRGIAHELQGTYAQLAESKYAKFLVGKLLVQNDEATRNMIISEFYGKVRKLINHPEASWILDDVYRGVASSRQRAMLLREWYGAEYALANTAALGGGNGEASSGEPTADLKAILEKEPSKRGAILKHLMAMINGLVQKKLTGFTMLHDAMLQYYMSVPTESEDRKEFLEVVKGDEGGDLLKNMAFTKSGARLVCLLLAYGDAKDRKHLLRTYKDTFRLLCGDPHGHAIILAACDLVDDTKLTGKTIFPEILGKGSGGEEGGVENIIFVANDLNARTTVLYLLEGASKALFPASHAGDVAMLEEIHAIRATTSKKEPEVRRRELVAAVSPQLLAAIAAAPRDLVATSFGCQLVTDVLLFAAGDKVEALTAIAQTAAGPTDAGAAPEAEDEQANRSFAASGAPHVSQSQFGTRMLKTLVAGGRFDRVTGQVQAVDPPLRFADLLYPRMRDHVMEWATGTASSFVVVALLEAGDLDAKHAAELRATLAEKKNRKALERAATEETAEQKARREADKDKDKTEGGDKGKKGKSQKAAPAVGNAGAKLLLEKLACGGSRVHKTDVRHVHAQ